MVDDFTYNLLTRIARGRLLRKDQYTHLVDGGFLDALGDDIYTLTKEGTNALLKNPGRTFP